MQENLKQEKRTKSLYIIATCLLLVLFTASIFLAVIAPVFTSNGVASAIDVTLPDNGIVGDNLLSNSTFSNTGTNDTYTGNVTNFITGWNLGYGTVSWDSNGYLSHNNTSGTWQGIYFDFVDAVGGHTYTFTVRGFSLTSQWGIYCFNYPSSGNRVQIAAKVDNTSEFSTLSITFTVPSDFGTIRLFVYGQAANGNFTLQWSKLEEGSSFTGYVPDFKNQINDLQNQVDSQKDTVANYKFSQRFLTTIDMPSRRLFINMSRLPKFSSKGFVWTSLQNYASLNYFAFTTESSDNVWASGAMNEVSTLGWKLNYSGNSFTTAELCIGDKVIFSYDVTGSLTGRGPTGSYPTDSDIDNAVVSNPKWYIASNMEYEGIKVYKYDFSGDVSYWYLYTKRSYGGGQVAENTLLDEMYSGSCWCYSFALNDTKDWVDLTNDVYYDLGYKSGVDSGYTGGYSDGHNKGYNEGFSAGKQNGYDIGYSEGVSAGQDYSFSALFGAVFDVPIQAFKGLFNFEIFGVNMTSFVSSLLALCVIVVIVKICLGGK